MLQFEVHKRRNGDNIKEHDKYYNGYRRDICFQEGSEQEGLGCTVSDGRLILS